MMAGLMTAILLGSFSCAPAGNAGGQSRQGIASAKSVKKSVLLLFPFQVDLISSELAVSAIREELGAAPDMECELFFEFLDINRFPDPDVTRQQIEMLAAKYGDRPIDLVMVQSPRMLDLWLENRAGILPAVPVVFYDLSAGDSAGRLYPQDIRGVDGVYDFVRTVEWMAEANPSLKEIVVVHGMGKQDQRSLGHLAILEREMAGKLIITDISGLTPAEMEKRVAVLPVTSAVLYFPLFEDAAGIKQRPANVLRMLAAASSVPVLTGFDSLIGTGTVGGYMYSIAQQAREAARIGLRILRGESPESIPISMETGNRFIFDHTALLRYGIPLSALPPESIVKNRQYSAWELYRFQIVAVAVVFLLLVLLLALLLLALRRLRLARSYLRRSNNELEIKVGERTAALAASERLMRLVIDNVPGLVAYWNPELRCEFANAHYEEYYGRSVEEMRGIGVREVLGEELYARNEPRMRAVLRGEPQDFEQTITKPDGSVIHTYSHYLPDFDETDRVRGFFVTASDVTPLKNAQLALRYFEAIVESSRDAIISMDLEGKATSWNRGATETFGYEAHEMIGNPLTRLFPPELQDEEIGILRRIEQGETVKHFETRRIPKDGTAIDVSVMLSPIQDTTGAIVGASTIYRDISAQKEAQNALERLARTDTLTGLSNRRHFMELAASELNRTVRYGGELSLLMMDLDHFKSVNDRYGHHVGDLVLQSLSSVCGATLREIDAVGRIGGEEFAVVLPQTDGSRAFVVAERLRKAIMDTPLALRDGTAVHFTVSIGVATLMGDQTDLDGLLACADKALYAAKNGGRNRVSAWA